MSKIYILTGPSGVGKTTVTKALCEKLNKCAVLEGDEIYNQVKSGKVSPWLLGNHTSLMWKNIISLAKNYLSEGYDIIINYIINNRELCNLVKNFPKTEVHFVILMAEKSEIVRRDEIRPEDEQMHRVDVHLNMFKNEPFDKKYFFDTTFACVQTEVEEIISGKFLLQESTDLFMGLRNEYFTKIKYGEKIFEGRVYDDKRKQIKIGDKINFYNDEKNAKIMQKVVKNIYIYDNFEDFCVKCDMNKLGFSSKEKMIDTYKMFYYKEIENGEQFVAIEVGD